MKVRNASEERNMTARLLMWGQVIFVIVGLVVAGYLTYSYTVATNDLMVCGPGGGCDEVRASPFAWVAGVPVPVVELLSYIVLAVLLVISVKSTSIVRYGAMLGMLVVSVSGLIFSWYLTYIELHLLQMVCDWCITSTLAITVLAGMSIENVRREIKKA